MKKLFVFGWFLRGKLFLLIDDMFIVLKLLVIVY